MKTKTPREAALYALGVLIGIPLVAAFVALAGATWPVAWLAALYLTLFSLALNLLAAWVTAFADDLAALLDELQRGE